MDTNLLILLVVVLFVILLAAGFMLYSQEASGEIKAGPFSFLFRGRNAGRTKKPAAAKPSSSDVNIEHLRAGRDAMVDNSGGGSTTVSNSQAERDFTVTNRPAPEAKNKPSKS